MSIDSLFGRTLVGPKLGHTDGSQNGRLGEQIGFQVLEEQTGMKFTPLQNRSNQGGDGVYIDDATQTIFVAEVKSSQNGLAAAEDAAGSPVQRLRQWATLAADEGPRWRNQAPGIREYGQSIQDALENGYIVKGIEVKAALPKPGTDATTAVKVKERN